MAEEEDAMEATLELTILSAEGLKSPSLFAKARPFAVAWLDPSLKKSTKTLNPALSPSPKLHFPLSPRALRNPSSVLTVQILASRLPFRPAKLIGTATLPLSSVPLAGETLTLQLRRPSGRANGTVRVSARILWCLDCVSGVPAEVELSDYPAVDLTATPLPNDRTGLAMLNGKRGMEFLGVDPTAPPLPDDPTGQPMLNGMRGLDFLCIDQTAPPLLDDPTGQPMLNGKRGLEFLGVDPTSSPLSDDLTLPPMSDGKRGSEFLDASLNAPQPRPEGPGAWRSFLIGLASGAVAAVLVGAAGLAED